MRFMVMHKLTDEMETGLPPEPAVMEGIGKLMEDGVKQDVFRGGEGLKPTSQRLRIVYENGKRTIVRGPFKDARDLPAGFALLRVRSEEEAIAWCDKFAAVMGGTAALYLGPVVERWDLGMGAKPEGAPLRFLAVHQADAASENDTPPDPAFLARMGALAQEMANAGVFEAAGSLASTKNGARLRWEGGRATVIDGPFAESKELVAGYAIFDLPSKAEAIAWAKRFGEVIRVHEVDVRLMHEG